MSACRVICNRRTIRRAKILLQIFYNPCDTYHVGQRQYFEGGDSQNTRQRDIDDTFSDDWFTEETTKHEVFVLLQENEAYPVTASDPYAGLTDEQIRELFRNC
jgi:hypothetical protein